MTISLRAMSLTSLFLLHATAAAAQEDAVEKYRNFLPEELLALGEDALQSDVPMMYTGAANGALSPFGEVLIRSNLNVLLYNGVGDLTEAKKAFQRDIGDEQTGQLTVWQLHRLAYMASRQNMTSVDFFSFSSGGFISGDYSKVSGTLEIIDEKIAYPINHVVIECFKSSMICSYRQIALTLPDENSWVQSYSVGEIANESYAITRWQDDQIEAVPLQPASCRINQLSFNFAAKEFFEISKNGTGEDCETQLGVTLPKLEKPRVSRIIDGQEIIRGEFERISQEAYTFLSSDFRKSVDDAKARSEAAKSSP